MNIQVIKSTDGKDEYVLLPMEAYNALKPQIDKVLTGEYEEFDINDFVTNPVALLRINANLTQDELATRLGCSQAYISKLEGQDNVSQDAILKVKKACKN